MNEQVMNVLSKKWVVPAVVGVASFGGGLVAGYILGKRNGEVFEINLGDLDIPETKQDPNQLTIDFNQVAREMTKTEYMERIMNRVPPAVDYANAILEDEWSEFDLETEAEELLEEDELEEAIAEQMHQNLITDDGDNMPEIKNVFENTIDDDQWNYEDELSIRTPDQPYVISVDEFVADEAGCEQSTVTYYQGDDIMANEFDVPIYDYNSMMGDLKFGHGSNDSSVVYIRNEKLGLEWEVLLHTGRFDVEVRGYDVEDAYEKAELKHSVPRFRDE